MATTILDIRKAPDGNGVEFELSCSTCDLFAGHWYLTNEDLIEMAIEERSVAQQMREVYCSEACLLGRPLGA